MEAERKERDLLLNNIQSGANMSDPSYRSLLSVVVFFFFF